MYTERFTRGKGNFINCTDYDDAVKAINEAVAETRSEMMEFAEWLSENPVIADNREETKTSRCVYIDDGNLFEFDTLDELFQYYLTNIKANENSR